MSKALIEYMSNKPKGIMEKVKRVRHLEAELKSAKKDVARSLRQVRESKNLTLRQVGIKLKMDPSTINLLERGITWNTASVRKIARLYDKLAAA